jgi:hypothetical protein
LGTWTVTLYETPATKKADDKVTIDKMVWTTDSSYTTMKTSFAQGETLYIKAIGLESGKYYNFRLDPPTGSSIYVFSSYQYVSGTELTGSYVLPLTAQTGEWKLHVRKADNAAGTSHEGHYVDRYFTVTPYVPPPTATITFSQVGVGTDFTGVVLTVDDTDYYVSDLPKSFTWDVGTDHSFEYYSPLTVNGKRYVWTSTEELSTEQSGTIHVTGDGTVTAYYKTQYYLTVVSPYDMPGGEGWYDEDATAYATLASGIVDLAPGKRAVFTGWTGDASGTGLTSDAITMSGPKTATALWVIQWYLDVYVDPPEAGTVPGEGWYDECTTVTLTAPEYLPSEAGTDGARYRFDYWDVDGTEVSGNPITVHMDSAHVATAHYVQQYYLTVKTDPEGLVTIPGEGWYDECTEVELTAPDATGYLFVYWDVDGTAVEGNPITVHMDTCHTATAHYWPELGYRQFVTDSNFNVIERFNIVWTPKDAKKNTFKLASTNPGQFMLNIVVNNTWPVATGPITITFTIDKDFILKGADPIQVYDGYGKTGNRIPATVTFDPATGTGTVTIENINPGTTYYITVHMEYGPVGGYFPKEEMLKWKENHPSNTFYCGYTVTVPGPFPFDITCTTLTTIYDS